MASGLGDEFYTQIRILRTLYRDDNYLAQTRGSDRRDH